MVNIKNFFQILKVIARPTEIKLILQDTISSGAPMFYISKLDPDPTNFSLILDFFETNGLLECFLFPKAFDAISEDSEISPSAYFVSFALMGLSVETFDILVRAIQKSLKLTDKEIGHYIKANVYQAFDGMKDSLENLLIERTHFDLFMRRVAMQEECLKEQ